MTMMKKGWTALLAALALMMVCIVAQADALQCGVTYRSATVNLRQQPTQYSTRLGSYAEGSWMVITGESGNWYYVTAPARPLPPAAPGTYATRRRRKIIPLSRENFPAASALPSLSLP